MDVTQYIGARYVPKFYENEDGTAEWSAGVAYEPLTIVMYNTNSYTSKRPVPASVGNPSANPSYWVATGIFNEQLANLVNRVNSIESSIGNTVRVYNTVLDMLADGEHLAAGNIAFCGGYYALNDGGGGYYIIGLDGDLRITGAVLYASLIMGTTANVKQFGAYGDGSHDDTEAFKKAFEYDDVYIPTGLYIINSKIQYHGGQHIWGDGRNLSRFRINTSSCGFGGDTTALTNHIHIEKIRFEFFGSGRTEPPIILINSQRLYIENCQFNNLDGIKTQAEVLITKNSNVANSWAHRIMNNYFYKCRMNVVYVTDSWFVRNDWNCIEDQFCLRIERGDGMIINENQMIAPLEIAGAVGTQVISNYFDGYVAHDNPARWNAINITGVIRSLIIANNRFYQTPGRGIYNSYTGTQMQDVLITGNSFEFCDCFDDGVPDIDLGIGSAVPIAISDNIGNRYTKWTINADESVTSSARTASAPFFQASGGAVNKLNGNAIHNGYMRTAGDYAIAVASGADEFNSHYFGAITNASGQNRFTVMGMVATFENSPALIHDIPMLIHGLNHTVEIGRDGDTLLITKAYDRSGEEISTDNLTVYVSSPKY